MLIPKCLITFTNKITEMRNLMTISKLLVFSLSIAVPNAYSQDLEVAGKVIVGQVEKNNDADSVIVRLSDGTLGVRDVSWPKEYQVLSISNDTIFLTNGDFVKLPVAESEMSISYNTKWSDYASGHKLGTFYVHNGRVYIDGLVKKSDTIFTNDLIGTLPTEYRPSAKIIGGGSIEEGYVRIDINTNGQINIRFPVGLFSTSGDWVGLQGISFRID